MTDVAKIGITIVGIGFGALVVYVTRECIKEYNSVIAENDKLREYIAKELIARDCKVNTVFSNGKRIEYEPVKQSVPKIIKEMEDNDVHIKKYDNGFSVISFKTKGA